MFKMSRNPGSVLSFAHRLFDVAMGVGILLGLYGLFWPDVFDNKSVQIALLVVAVAAFTIFGFRIAGVYKPWARSEIVTECNRIVFGVILVFAGMLILGYLFKVSQLYSRRVILLWLVAWPAVLCFERLIVKKYASSWLAEGEGYKKVVIAGAGMVGANIADWIADNPWSGLKIVGFFDSKDVNCNGSAPCLGRIEDLGRYVRQKNIDVVYVALPMREEEKLHTLLKDMEDSAAQVYFFPDMSIFAHLLGGDVAQVAGQTAIILRSSPFEGISGLVKRLEDIVISSMILLLISPIMIAIAVGIKLSSRGPVMFRQWRYGLGGEPFQIYKFRTMKVIEDGYDFVPATKDDPRVTRLGSFLRKNSLDELPQFINVIQGRMSIVGPRPHAVKMNEEYRKRVPGYMLRHISKPGITGFAQVNGYKGEIQTEEDMEQRIKYDIRYLQNWSLFLDLEIIFKTVFNRAWRQ